MKVDIVGSIQAPGWLPPPPLRRSHYAVIYYRALTTQGVFRPWAGSHVLTKRFFTMGSGCGTRKL